MKRLADFLQLNCSNSDKLLIEFNDSYNQIAVSNETKPVKVLFIGAPIEPDSEAKFQASWINECDNFDFNTPTEVLKYIECMF